MTLRALSWPGEDGRPSYVRTGDGTSFVSRWADDLASVRLDRAGELLRTAERSACGRVLPAVESAELVRCLCAALRDVLRIAESRAPSAPVRDGGVDVAQSCARAAEPVAKAGEPVVRRWWPEAQYVGAARTLLRRHLEAWGMAELADTAVLVLSELHGNAVRHARFSDAGVIETRFERLADATLRIEVHDGDATKPELVHSAPDAASGRGLELVDALTGGRWGVSDRGGPGKAVWAECGTPD